MPIKVILFFFFQFQLPHSTVISVDVLKECKGNLYQEHRRFQQSFDPRWRTDENIMLILSAITLFTPARSNIVHHDVIKLEQVRLMKLIYLVYN